MSLMSTNFQFGRSKLVSDPSSELRSMDIYISQPVSSQTDVLNVDHHLVRQECSVLVVVVADLKGTFKGNRANLRLLTRFGGGCRCLESSS